MDDESKLTLLIKKKEFIFRDIQILYNLIKEVKSDSSKISTFRSRYQRIESLRDEFVETVNDINVTTLSINPKSIIDFQSVQSFDELYYSVTAAAETILKQPQVNEPKGFQNTSSQVRLPKIELQKFDSNIENWQTFNDTFLALVHNNENISKIEKFHYLLSCLSGSALSIAKGVPVTSDNYEVVYESLVERFQNKRILAANYLEKICNLTPLRSCNFSELRHLASLLQESVNALKAIKLENLGEFILFHLAARGLDIDTRKRFETQNTKEIPTFNDLLTFLQSYVKIMEVSDLRLSCSNNSVDQQRQKFNSKLPQNKNYNKVYKSSSFPVNTETYSPPGPYSELGPQLEMGQCHYSDVETGPYSDFKPCSDSESGPYSDRHEYQTGMYLASVPNNKFPDCVCCGFSHHAIYKCPLFHSYNMADRQKVIKTKKLCVNCLRPNHTADKCLSKSTCSKCNARHHSLVHDQDMTTACPTTTEVVPETVANSEISMSSTSTSANLGDSRTLVLLGTCVVRIRTSNSFGYARALIDSGAQDCFMTSACAQRLGLPLRRCHITVSGLGKNTINQVKGVTSCIIQPRHSESPHYEICPIVMDTITTQMPAVEIPINVRDTYKHLVLADDKFDKPHNIDLLIGAELFHNIYDGQRLDFGPDLPTALHSVFGWVITGKLDFNFKSPACTSNLLVSTLNLDNAIKKFWEIEEPPAMRFTNPEDDKCEELYLKYTTRKPDGRYVVPILRKESHDVLGDSYGTARSRLVNIEKRLQRHNQLKEDYVNFMREYSDLGHMRPVESKERGLNIIPHHCVLRPESSTTKLRVVFDGSAATSNGISLNNIVHTGPKLQNNIVDIVTKFRLPNIVFTADISKMYRNIDLCPNDRKYQHILWRDCPENPICEYELNTVTYGVSSSPFLAIRTLHQLAADHGAQWPQAAKMILHDTFMDDITGGASSVKEALKLKNDLILLLGCGKFELRKWSSNSPEFLADLPVEHCQVPKVFLDDVNQYTLKILGIQWDPVSDNFTYSFAELDANTTKRSILSSIARIYDPLGWLAPMVLTAKLLMQDLWRNQLDWDEPVPESIADQWKKFISSLRDLKFINIPRQVIHDNATVFELIGFCDGSSQAYGCCVYLRSVGSNNITVQLLIAKTRVAPLKSLTTNRLELCGALLLAGTLNHIHQLLNQRLLITNMIAFTDSSTVLAWLKTPPFKLKTFVSHRVVKITDAVPIENWNHVSTHDNSADHCSRGLTCSQLASSELWWSGPKWLSYDSASWPIPGEISFSESIPELKTTVAVTAVTEELQKVDIIGNLLENHSSLNRVQRILAWCLRFISNMKHKNIANPFLNLTTNELSASLLTLVRHEQISFLADEIKAVQVKKLCRREIQKLKPYIDEAGLLRVGGRLKNSELSLPARNPLLLPKHSRLSILIIDYFHCLYLHCGPRTLQSLILRKYWIMGIRNLIRSRLSKCVQCFKVNPISCKPIMGDLPPFRVQQARCFQNVGIDFAGPFTLKESKRRNARTYKAYVCVIVCLAVKAIHLELVTELSTQAFIAALDRAVSRRGLCKLIITDCGTNFIGARRYLQETQQFLLNQQSELQAELTKRQIEWHLNPPTGSHFGGIFESGVKAMKYHLKRAIGLQVLTFEEMVTVLSKIEAVLNSRPLCTISTDPDEVDVLTPGHLLIGGPLVSLPEPGFEDVYLPPRERWQLLQKTTQTFWRKWQYDYLHTLQQRSKWLCDEANINIGDIVLIMEQNLPPLEWRIGKIVETHPGSDGVVRVVSLRTSKGLYKIPVSKLCPLPLSK